MSISKQLSETIGRLQEAFGEDNYPQLLIIPDVEIQVSSAAEYLILMREYINEAGAHFARNPDPNGNDMALKPLLITTAFALNCVADFDMADSLIESNHVKYTEISTTAELIAICLGAINKGLNHYYETLDTSLESYIEEFAAIIYSFLEFSEQLELTN